VSTHPSTRVLAISTLSPVHIGCGDVYEPSGFVIHDGLLHAFDAADLADALSEKEHRQLARLAEQAEPIGAIQRFFRESAAGLAQLARHQVDIVPALAREYADKIGQPTHRDPNGEATYNNFQLARTAYRPLDNAPYLPGSSLKGSIRTAWLNQKSLDSDIDWQDRSGKNSAATIEQRLLGYRAGEFQNDPFRLLALADANPEDADNPPPGRVLYAISKRKRLPRPGDKDPNSELKIFLETIPEALPTAFVGEMRFGPGARISWRALCDACNAYYRPRLEQELRHPVLGHLLDKNWSALIADLLGNELGELLAARQGFLLRVGRHAGAESVTLDGLRRIKILGPRVGGKQTFEFRPTTSQNRYASPTRHGDGSLLPFGWLWIDACDDRHRHLADAVRQKLARRSRPLLEDHRDRLARREEKLAQHAARLAQRAAEKEASAAAERAAAQAEEQRQRELAAMTPNHRRIAQFAADFAARADQLRGNKENPNATFHGLARALARDAAAWPLDERLAAADAIEHWLPRVVRIDLKDERKKLKLAALRTPT
jgi:CRISPR-associated protein Csm5